MGVGSYMLDLRVNGYNLDGTVAVYGSAAPPDLQGKPIVNAPSYGSAIAVGGGVLLRVCSLAFALAGQPASAAEPLLQIRVSDAYAEARVHGNPPVIFASMDLHVAGPGSDTLESVKCNGVPATVWLPESRQKEIERDAVGKIIIRSPGLNLRPSAAMSLTGPMGFTDNGHLIIRASSLLSRSSITCQFDFGHRSSINFMFTRWGRIQDLINF